MKKTDFIKQINKENRKYNIIKLKSYLRLKCSFGENRRQQKFAYSIFEDQFSLDKHNNALPKSLYFKPTDIIIYDLIRKEDLIKTQKGLIRLIKKCYSHKFLGGSQSEENVDELINGLNQTIHSGNSWYNTSLFDFAYNNDLESYIHHFTIRFHNFSSSYVAIEMQIVLSDEFVTEISQFIGSTYKKNGMCVHRHWGRNKAKSGAKILYGVSSGVQSECAKSQIVYEQLQYIKKLFLHEIVKYFPLVQYSIKKNSYGVNVFETNITPSMELEYSVYNGLGLDEMQGFFFSAAERLYASTRTLTNRRTYDSDMMFVYNADRIIDFEGYFTAHNKALVQLTLDHLDELYRVIVIKNLGLRYQELISEYRNKVNKCKNKRRQHKALLKLQYDFNRDFYDFKKIDEELPVNKVLERAEKILKSNQYAKSSIYHGFHTLDHFTGYPKWIWEQIGTNYFEVENDLNRKKAISDSLSKYSSERKNRRMIAFQVVLALVTFFLLLFPSKAQDLAALIRRIWLWLKSIFIV